jgi:hypothetical protein
MKYPIGGVYLPAELATVYGPLCGMEKIYSTSVTWRFTSERFRDALEIDCSQQASETV